MQLNLTLLDKPIQIDSYDCIISRILPALETKYLDVYTELQELGSNHAISDVLGAFLLDAENEFKFIKMNKSLTISLMLLDEAIFVKPEDCTAHRIMPALKEYPSIYSKLEAMDSEKLTDLLADLLFDAEKKVNQIKRAASQIPLKVGKRTLKIDMYDCTPSRITPAMEKMGVKLDSDSIPGLLLNAEKEINKIEEASKIDLMLMEQQVRLDPYDCTPQRIMSALKAYPELLDKLLSLGSTERVVDVVTDFLLTIQK